MRLCNIKLSGFKSFVDPTNLIVPGSLVGIVGPNGCGKSNIIDAVTWVMGESSAKHLRGESLTDVIFSGSSARQPVGQASVELVFDNTEKKLGGQYASYNEISIKRQINRDGVSTYSLNGTRCRRRDITAIFLGTGLGPRSYSIIEQGMISRLIEAKPEELRVYIEEAAGISKYRERRRETENRIKHTKENIERLNDIRDELEKQLNHLQRQAKAAERYKELKKEERQLTAELLAINWRDLNKEMTSLKEQSREKENTLEASVAKVRELEAEIEKQRETLSEANQLFNDRQSDFYKVGSDISQYEQQLQHTREKITAIEEELQKAQHNYEQSEQQHKQDKADYEKLLSEMKTLEPQLDGSRTESNRAYELLNQSEEAMQVWQSEWDSFNESFTEFSRQEQVDRTRFEHLQTGIEDLKERRYNLQSENNAYQNDDSSEKIPQLEQSLRETEQQLQVIENEYTNNQQQLKTSREQIRVLSEKLNKLRHDSQSIKGELTSLETTQRSIIDEDQELSAWLSANDMEDMKRLSQLITIEDEWAHALETVTKTHLHDFCTDELQVKLEKMAEAPGKFGLISTTDKSINAATKSWPRLLDFVTSEVSIPSLLNTIYVADSLDNALKMLPELPESHSIVTKQGVWLSHHWALVNHSSAAVDTVIAREQEISSLKSRMQQSEQELQSLEQQYQQAESELETIEKNLANNQSSISSKQQLITELKTELASLIAEDELRTNRSQQILDELDSLDQQEQKDKQEMETISDRLGHVEQDKQRFLQQRQELSETRERHRQSLADAKTRWQSTHEESHGIALQLESFSSKKASYEQAFKRNEFQLEHLNKRISELQQQLSLTEQPVKTLQKHIESALELKLVAEKNLADARTSVQTIEQRMRELEQQRQQQEQGLESLRASLEKARINVNSCQVRLETVLEQLNAHEQKPEAILEQLSDEDANQQDWNEKLEAIARKVQRLGPINLAAIDEYTQNAERKTYLDSQHKDLIEALTTLENAIRKIDKETRTRFKETFDELNTNIKDMFPRLFGGGHAYLELTGDDLLQTGVAIMARPPGKKNSNIHLLSGGEKALTAVALVFAIFKLNPAPFCILDEVDAPLDDTNVGRFSQLVKSMSDEVQFIFITHNKITMEIAQQLMGVTMHEAGVSRLVSVDVDEAAKMAATA